MPSLLSWRAAPMVGAGIPSAISPVVIGGCGSSGTTLLRQMLNRHPQVYCGPESRLFLPRMDAPEALARRFDFPETLVRRWRDESLTRAEFVERFQAACLARSGKSVFAEKTPENIRHFPAIARRFPRARLVHVIRDGRDVACSLRQAGWLSLEKMTAGAERRSPEALETCIRYWAERVAFGRSQAGPNYHEIRYEALLADPETALRHLLAFAGLDFDPAVLDADAAAETRDGRPISSASVGRWRAELSPADGLIVDRCAGSLLADLGYAPDRSWIASLPEAPPAPPALSRPAPPSRPLGQRLKARLKDLRREAVALSLMLQDADAPGGPRIAGALAAIYAASPLDLIPDRTPRIGYLDDLAVAGFAVWLMARLAPTALMRRHRIAAARLLSRHVWRVAGARPQALAGALSRLVDAAALAGARLLGATRTPAYVVDSSMRFVTVSPAALRTWNKDPDEVLGRRILEVFPAASRISYSAHLDALRNARARRVSVLSRTLGRPLTIAIRPVSDGLRVQFSVAA